MKRINLAHRGVDAASLGIFRIAFGLIVAGAGFRYLAKGWLWTHFIEPDFAFSYPGLAWLECHDPLVVHLRLFGIIAAALFLAVGYRTRTAAFVLFLLFTWQHLSDKALYLNHYHLVSLFALTASFAPLGAAYSIDARMRRGAGASRPPAVPGEWLSFFRFLVVGVYFWAAIAKLNADWLLEHQPLRIWFFARSELPLIGPVLALPESAAFASWFGFLFDLTIPAFLLWRRTRTTAFCLLVGFHLATQALFPIGIFPWIMISAASLMLDPAWPRRWSEDRISLKRSASPSPAMPGGQRLALLAVTFLLMVIPLRGLFYGGNILWHERGFRFSWRVMAMEKRGFLSFDVLDAEGQWLATRRPENFLTPLQAAMASTQPDMILQAGEELRRRESESRGHPVRIRVEARTSLNGCPSYLILDPTRDMDTITVHESLREAVRNGRNTR